MDYNCILLFIVYAAMLSVVRLCNIKDAMIIVSNDFGRMKKEVFIAWFKVFQSGTEENHKKCK